MDTTTWVDVYVYVGTLHVLTRSVCGARLRYRWPTLRHGRILLAFHRFDKILQPLPSQGRL